MAAKLPATPIRSTNHPVDLEVSPFINCAAFFLFDKIINGPGPGAGLVAIGNDCCCRPTAWVIVFEGILPEWDCVAPCQGDAPLKLIMQQTNHIAKLWDKRHGAIK